MFSLLVKFFSAGRETKWFLINCFVYGFLIIVSAIYCYMRLDYVRSYKTPPSQYDN